MSTWTLIQIVFDIFMACGIFVVVMRMNRAPKDDPRLSRGLALLQSKIAVLEDLSDRTEQQVSSLVSILENKAREVQAKVELADRHVNEIRVSMERSLEVASIFQDKIPHQEIIERQNTLKYVSAARLAHSGLSVDEIATRVDLPRGELEFISSVNRDRLMFNEAELPEWAKGASVASSAAAGESLNVAPALAATDVSTESNEDRSTRMRAEIELAENQRLVESLSKLQFEMQNLDMQLARDNTVRDIAGAYDVPKVETDHLKKLGEEFRKAVRDGEASDSRHPLFPPIENLSSMMPSILEAAEQIPGAGSPMRTMTAAVPMAPVVQAAPIVQAARAMAAAAPTPPTVKDPVLARAAAQAKVQAALRTSSVKPATQQRTPSALDQARAVGKSAAKPGEVRKVMFPRIDGSDV